MLKPTIYMAQLFQPQAKVFGESSHIFLGICFQIFLDKLADKYPDSLNVVQLDNGKFHHSSSLKVPSGYSTGFSTTIQPRIKSRRQYGHT
jgi:hypothetical protein